MLISLKEVLNGNYIGLGGQEVEGFKIVENKVVTINDDGDESLETVLEKEVVLVKDNSVNIEGENAFIVKYKHLDNEDNYYVAYPKPRVKDNTIVMGQDITDFILTQKADENGEDEIVLPFAKSSFNGNVNNVDITFDTMDDFLSAEKDINSTYIVGNKYEVYFDGNVEDSEDYCEKDYNDWFVHVMYNSNGHYTKDGLFILGYLLQDFMANRGTIEEDVASMYNRVDLYSK